MEMEGDKGRDGRYGLMQWLGLDMKEIDML